MQSSLLTKQFWNAPKLSHRLELVEIFCLTVHKARHFSWGSWENRHHGAVAFHAGGKIGWGEFLLSSNGPVPDLDDCIKPFRQLLGVGVGDALKKTEGEREIWNHRHLEAAQFGLIDLAGHLMEKPSIHLLGLDQSKPVPGLACVLEPNPALAAKAAKSAIEAGLDSHLKIKIFGDPDLDLSMVQEVRKAIPATTYLIADVNEGYGKKEEVSFQDLVTQMKRLHQKGLNACEDPAHLSHGDWIKLQVEVGDLDLIPDMPNRPSWVALEKLPAGMGRIYNLHPACMGSILCAIELAHRIKKFGAGVMIGDNSLVGPGCTAWQQIAVGLGAEWVEAIEKPMESETFLNSIQEQATEQKPAGKFGFTSKPQSGFGLRVDRAGLREAVDSYTSINL